MANNITVIFKKKFSKPFRLLMFLSLVFVSVTSLAQTPPVAVDDHYSCRTGSSIVEAVATGALSNDTGVGIQVTQFYFNGTNNLAGSSVNEPGVGTLLIKPDGSLSFSPAAGFTGAKHVKYYIKDTDGVIATAYVHLYVDKSNIVELHLESFNQGYIQPRAEFPNGAYKIQYLITFINVSIAKGYDPDSQVTGIQIKDDLEAAFGDPCVLKIERGVFNQNSPRDGEGGRYPMDWRLAGFPWDTDEFPDNGSAGDPTPGADGIIDWTATTPDGRTANQFILYPKQYISLNFCVYIEPNCAGRPFPVDAGSGITFTNTVKAVSSEGTSTKSKTIKDFHTQESFITAALHFYRDAPPLYTVQSDLDGTYTFDNHIIIKNDGPNPANNVNYNYALGPWIDKGVSFTSTISVSPPGFTPNAGFDGDNNAYLLAPNQTLNPGDKVVITIHHKVAPVSNWTRSCFLSPKPSLTYGHADGYDETTAVRKRQISFVTWSDARGQHVDRFRYIRRLTDPFSSDDQCKYTNPCMYFASGIVAKLNLTKEIRRDVITWGDPTHRDVTFRLTAQADASNNRQLDHLVLKDNLKAICGDATLISASIVPGLTNATTNPTINGGYTGGTSNIFNNDGVLKPGEQVVVDIKVRVPRTCSGVNIAKFNAERPTGDPVDEVTAMVNLHSDFDIDGINDDVDLDDDNDGIPDLEEHCEAYKSQNASGPWVGETSANLTVTTTDVTHIAAAATYKVANQIPFKETDKLKTGTVTGYTIKYTFDTPVKASEVAIQIANVDYSYASKLVVSGGTATAANFKNFDIVGTPKLTYDPVTGDISAAAAGSTKTSFLVGNGEVTLTQLEIQIATQNPNDKVTYTLYGAKVCNMDGDELPNYYDLDADGDGIYDIVEAGNSSHDTADNNGMTDTAVGSNGLDNGLEDNDTAAANINYIIPNTDTTGGYDFVDIDADDDGIVDNVEGQPTSGYRAPGGSDADYNGVDDKYDTNGTWINPTNTEGVDNPDYIDTNSDNDVDSDALEGWDTNNDGVADTTPLGVDVDHDGLDDGYDINVVVPTPTNGQIPRMFPKLDRLLGDRDWRDFNPPPTVTIEDLTVNENVGNAVVTINLSNPYSTDVVINISTADGTAAQPIDYTNTSVTVTIPAGQTSVTVSIPIIDDIIDEPTETFEVNGLVTSSNTANANPSGTVTITDNDGKLSVVKTVTSITDNDGDGIDTTGDTIKYGITVTNTGNSDLTLVNITDPLTGASFFIGNLSQGSSITKSTTYTLTQTDIDNGSVCNTAEVSYQTPDGNSYTNYSDDGSNVANSDDPGDTEPDNDPDTPTCTNFTIKPYMTVYKTGAFGPGNDTNANGMVDAGETVSYTITITNTGNVTLSNIQFTDIGVTVTSGTPIPNLAPGATATVTVDQTVTQAAIDSGAICNQATITYDDPQGNTYTNLSDDGLGLGSEQDSSADNDPGNDPDDETCLSDMAVSKVSVDKVIDGSITDVNANGMIDAGDVIHYTLTVTNIGNTNLSNVIVNDDMADYNHTIGAMAPGQTVTLTVDYTLTQNDLDVGGVCNTAIVLYDTPAGHTYTNYSDDGEGIGPDNDNPLDTEPDNDRDDPTCTHIEPIPTMKVIKTGILVDDNGNGREDAGETVKFTITITNTGNVTLTNVTVDDAMIGLVAYNAGSILPGEDHKVEVTGDYTLTQADIDNGKVCNRAKVTYQYPSGGSTTYTNLSDDGDDTGSNMDDPADDDPGNDPDDYTCISIERKPELKVEKTDGAIIDVNGNAMIDAGDKIPYTITVTNTGNTTLTDVTVSDAMLGINNNLGTMAPGQTLTITGTYILTQADIDNGSVANQARVTYTNSEGNSFTNDSDDPDVPDDVDGGDSEPNHDPDDPTITYITQLPTMTVIKTGALNDANANGMADAGEYVAYTITVTNTGNVTLSNVQFTDAGVTVISGLPISDMAPGTSVDIVVHQTIAQADIQVGTICNQAKITYDDPLGNTYTNLSDDGYLSGSNQDDLGDNDPLRDPDDVTCVSIPGDSRLKVEKVDGPIIDANANGMTDAGDQIPYTITVENIGNTNLTDVILTDPNTHLTVSIGDMSPGDIRTYNTTYTLTITDFNNKEASNLASVIYTATDGTYTNYSDDPDDHSNIDNPLDTEPNDDPDDPTVTDLSPEVHPALEVFKDDNLSYDCQYLKVGDIIHYAIIIKNTGNVTLTDINVVDHNPGAVIDTPLPVASIDPGSEVTVEAHYVVTQADIDNGYVSNSVTASTLYEGNTISDDSDDTDPDSNQINDSDPTITHICQRSMISVLKTGTLDLGGDGALNAGDVIHFVITVENTGNTLINIPAGGVADVPVTDRGGSVVYVSGDDNGNGVLDVGETWTYHADYNITQDDINAGKAVNQAVVTYTDRFGMMYDNASDDPDVPDDVDGNDTEVYDDPDDPTIIDLTPYWETKISVIKTAEFNDMNGDGIAQANETITYTIVVKNIGSVEATQLTLDDALVGISGQVIGTGTIQPGYDETVTLVYNITQDDLDNNCGHVCNQALVKYADPNGNQYQNYSDDPDSPANVDIDHDGDPDDRTCMDLPMEVRVSLIKSDDFDSTNCTQAGDIITYTFEVSNQGSASFNDVKIVDDILSESDTPVTYVSGDTNDNGLLDTDETWIYTAAYPVNQADIDAGHFDNQASVTVTDNCDNTGTDLSDPSDTTTDNPTVTNFVQCSGISLEKIGVFNDENEDGFAEVGETITYYFKVINDSNVSIHDLSVEDPLVAVAGGPLDIIAPGHTDSETFKSSYVITKNDLVRGYVSNQATVSGFDVNGNRVSDISDDPQTPEIDDPTIVSVIGVFIPEIFTPNGDGINDTFEIFNLDKFDNPTLKVYNRWGALVYEADPYENNWDGTSQAKLTFGKSVKLPVGTYYYILDLGVNRKPITGFVYLDK